MRKIAVVVAAAVACLVVPGLASATHSNGQGPGFDKVDGTGQSSTYGQVHVNAKNQSGRQGRFFINPPVGPGLRGNVTCLDVTVTGREAFVGGIDDQTGMPVVIFIHDGGEPGVGNDLHAWTFVTPELLSQCRGTLRPEPIQQGNYIVHGTGQEAG